MKADDLDQHVALRAARRRRLAQAMPGGVAVIPTAPERARNRDTHFPSPAPRVPRTVGASGSTASATAAGSWSISTTAACST